MVVMSLVAAVAPRTGKIIKNSLCVFEKRKTFTTKWYITLCIVWKEFKQTNKEGLKLSSRAK